MANAFATNYPIVGVNNYWNLAWKLTRTMKAAGWSYKASSNGNTKDTSGTAANDLWGGNANPLLDIYGYINTTSTGSQTLPTATLTVTTTTPVGGVYPTSGTISVATTTNGWQNVTYTGTTANSFTGCSGGTGTVPSGSEISNGATTIALDGANAWWVGSGPQTLKIPITAAPTGTPLRGETITQTISNAEGELVGFVFDATAGSGWMVVLPRVNTFDNTHTITGSASAATFTPNGTIVTYTREVMISKTSANATSGNIYYVCADISGESASLFSTLANSAGCTTSVWPGGGGISNSFPNIAITIRGGGGVTNQSDIILGGSITYSTNANAQIATVNAIPSTGVSADGSFYASAFNSQGYLNGFIFTRLDDSEPGDVDPYIWYMNNNAQFTTFSRTLSISASGNGSGFLSVLLASTYALFVGYQARGIVGKDVVSGYAGGITSTGLTGTYALNSNQPGAYRLLNHPASVTPLIREPIMIHTNATVPGSFRQLKGRTRWMAFFSTGNPLDTFDSKTWLVTTFYNTSYPVLGIAPFDGITSPNSSSG